MFRLLMLPTALLAALTACAADSAAPEPTSETSATETPSPTDFTPSITPDAAPEPQPSGTFRHSCDYVLGDGSNYTSTGYRFVADVNLQNTGNVGTVNQVTATWFLAGGGKVTETKSVRIPTGQRTRVGFTKPVGGDEIDLHQSLTVGRTCHVKVGITDTFGDPS